MSIKSFPSGAILPFPNNHQDSIPSGWLLCDGSSISRNTYSKLFSLVGTTYGPGNSPTEFNIPDLQEWFVKGVDTSSMRDSNSCLLYTSPSPRDLSTSRMPSSA